MKVRDLIMNRYSVLLILTIMIGTASAGQNPPFYQDKVNMLTYIDAQGTSNPIEKAEDWPKRRTHILENMQLVMGELPDRSNLPPLDIQIIETKTLDGVRLQKVTYLSEPGDRVPAYLLMPDELEGKAPAMLCLHQTTKIGKGEPAGLGGLPNLRYALELAQRGYVTLAPDYPNFGDYSFNPYENGYVSTTMKGIWNHMRAVDLLQSLPQVDAERVGSIGHSLGGHNTMYVAVFDERLKVLVSSCGFNSFFKYFGGDIGGWSHKGYMPRIFQVYKKDPSQMPFDFTEVVSALAPRHFFVNAPLGDDNFEVSGVKDCIYAANPVYDLLGVGDNLKAVYPDAQHDFPPEIRRQAYEFIDDVLKK